MTDHPARALWLLPLATALLSGCLQQQPAAPSDPPTSEPTARSAPKPPPKRPVVPAVSFRSSCDDKYPLVFQTGDLATGEGYRFVAEVRLWNESPLRTRVRLNTRWLFFGGGGVEQEKMLTLRPDEQGRRVSFSRPSTLDEVSRIVGWQQGDRLCRTKVTLP